MRSLLRPFLLLLIHERPGHGYELMERLGALGVRDVEPGQVYRALRALEREHCLVSVWVTSPTGPARRRYELTPEGLASLHGWAAQLGRLHQTVGSCLARLAETVPQPATPDAPDAPATRRRIQRAPGRDSPARPASSAALALPGGPGR